MPDLFHVKQIYQSDVVRVRDVRCRPHSHGRGAEEHSEANDIVFPRTGFFVRHIGRREFPADPNGVLFFRRNESYHVSHPVVGGDDCTALTFAPQILAEAFAAYDPHVSDHPHEPFTAAGARCDAATFTLVYRLRALLRAAPNTRITNSSLEVDELAVRLVDAVAREAVGDSRAARAADLRRADTVRAHRDIAENARVVLSKRMCEPLTLGAIAREVHSTSFHLSRVFERVTGSTIHRYLSGLRLRAALARIADGESNLTALALDLGFSSHSHLTSTFAREFGTPPSRLRAELS
jgi:AraC-like DNA-binding protein